MDKNTVLLSLADYNALRDFKKEITDGNVLVVSHSYGFGSGTTTKYYTDNEVAKMLGKERDDLKEAGKELKKEISTLKETIASIDAPKPITLDDIKRMNYWEFRKWQRG